jgi:acyl-CoA synthetase (AMP-forming)/AMP-acid ligase II
MFSGLVDRFRRHATTTPHRAALTYCRWRRGELIAESTSYAELDRQARQIAVWLGDRCRPGDRVLLCYPSGPAFIRVFLGCLYAGVLPVPTSMPTGYRHHALRTAGILVDARVSLVLTDADSLDDVAGLLPAGTEVLACELRPDADADAWRPVPVTADDTAFLQYTSGSTSDPKGVMVSQANLVHNIRSGRELLRIDPDVTFGSWLPTHHDMGLIAMTLVPLMSGGTAVFSAPMDFLRRPVSWLEMIDRFDVVVSAAPNFAYELCVRSISEEQAAGVDLSRWRRACNGAEPIDARTLERFTARFARQGFRPESLVAGYGMAETTLFAAGSVPDRTPVVTPVDAQVLQTSAVLVPADGPEIRLVGCGRPADLTVRIVDPVTRAVLPDGAVGEIWLRGPSVALGYWGRPEETDRTFRAGTADGDPGFLRTGDLGALHDGELYVTGRLKEMMIINGRNIYPQDVEREARAAIGDDVVLAACAFSVPVPAERLVAIAEVRTRGMTEQAVTDLATRARASLTATLGIGGIDLVIARPGQIRRTTSGKVQRGVMAQLFMAGELDVAHEALTEQTSRTYRRAGVPA